MIRLIRIILSVALFYGSTNIFAQQIMSNVNTFRETIDSDNLTTAKEAGADLEATYETATNFNQLDIKSLAASQDWKVTVSKQDIIWNSSLTIFIKRNSSGFPCTSCIGIKAGMSSANYIQLQTTETDFIFGEGEVTGIDIQLKVEGISVVLPAQSYSTEITYTLYGD